jgi:phage terminase large subunit
MFDYNNYNSVDRIYYFNSGSIMQFVPADDARRFQGPRQDFALFDEAYNIKKDIFDQVEIRTRRNIILTWNPVSPFWGKLLSDRIDCKTIHSTYKDNEYLEQSIIDSLEQRAGRDSNFYRVYVLGEYGSVEGLIFKENEHWRIVRDWPRDEDGKEYYKWRVYGLDFGFSLNPSAYIEIRYADGELWASQHIYKPGMTNDEIADGIKGLKFQREDSIADSAEPKSIREISRKGVKIRGAEKGPDSVKFGINMLKQYRLNVLFDSLDLIKEFRNYSWKRDQHGEFIGKPADAFNHGIDAIRYGVTYKTRFPGTGSYAVS